MLSTHLGFKCMKLMKWRMPVIRRWKNLGSGTGMLL